MITPRTLLRGSLDGVENARARIAFVAFVAWLPWLVGCQPTAVPVEQARKAKASFEVPPAREEPIFVPPPRTVFDVTAILDAQKGDIAPEIRKFISRADSLPPETSDPDALARYYFDRGVAARRIGRNNQAIRDLAQANGLVKNLSLKSVIPPRTRIHGNLWRQTARCRSPQKRGHSSTQDTKKARDVGNCQRVLCRSRRQNWRSARSRTATSRFGRRDEPHPRLSRSTMVALRGAHAGTCRSCKGSNF